MIAEPLTAHELETARYRTTPLVGGPRCGEARAAECELIEFPSEREPGRIHLYALRRDPAKRVAFFHVAIDHRRETT